MPNVGDAQSRWIIDLRDFERGVQLIREAKKLSGDLSTEQRKVGESVKSSSDKAETLRSKLSDIGNIFTGFNSGVAILQRVSSSLQNLAKDGLEFQQAFASAMANGGKEAKALEGDLRSLAIQLGKETAFSATEAAAGMDELVKAGVSVSDILGGALRSTLDVAAAGQISVAQAAEITANALNTFGLAGQDATHVGNLLAGAAVATTADIGDLGESLKQVGNVAAQVTKTSIDDTTTALALLAETGLKGSDAGTSLRTMLLRLNPTTKEARSAFEELGVSVFDSEGKMKPLRTIIGDLNGAFVGLTQEQKQTYQQMIFGQDAIRASTVLIEGGTEAWDRMKQTLSEFSAADVAKDKLDSLSGDVQILKGSISTLKVEALDAVTPALREWAQGAIENANAITEWVGENRELINSGLSTFLNDVLPLLAQAGVLYGTATVGARGYAAGVELLSTGKRALAEASNMATLATTAFAVAQLEGAGTVASLRAAVATLTAEMSLFQKSLLAVGVLWGAWEFGSWIGQMESVKNLIQDTILGLKGLEQENRRQEEAFDSLAASFTASREKMERADRDFREAYTQGNQRAAEEAARIYQAEQLARLNAQRDRIEQQLRAEEEAAKRQVGIFAGANDVYMGQAERLRDQLLEVTSQIATVSEEGWGRAALAAQQGAAGITGATQAIEGTVDDLNGWSSSVEQIVTEFAANVQHAVASGAKAVDDWGAVWKASNRAVVEGMDENRKAWAEYFKALDAQYQEHLKALQAAQAAELKYQMDHMASVAGLRTSYEGLMGQSMLAVRQFFLEDNSATASLLANYQDIHKSHFEKMDIIRAAENKNVQLSKDEIKALLDSNNQDFANWASSVGITMEEWEGEVSRSFRSGAEAVESGVARIKGATASFIDIWAPRLEDIRNLFEVNQEAAVERLRRWQTELRAFLAESGAQFDLSISLIQQKMNQAHGFAQDYWERYYKFQIDKAIQNRKSLEEHYSYLLDLAEGYLGQWSSVEDEWAENSQRNMRDVADSFEGELERIRDALDDAVGNSWLPSYFRLWEEHVGNFRTTWKTQLRQISGDTNVWLEKIRASVGDLPDGLTEKPRGKKQIIGGEPIPKDTGGAIEVTRKRFPNPVEVLTPRKDLQDWLLGLPEETWSQLPEWIQDWLERKKKERSANPPPPPPPPPVYGPHGMSAHGGFRLPHPSPGELETGRDPSLAPPSYRDTPDGPVSTRGGTRGSDLETGRDPRLPSPSVRETPDGPVMTRGGGSLDEVIGQAGDGGLRDAIGAMRDLPTEFMRVLKEFRDSIGEALTRWRVGDVGVEGPRFGKPGEADEAAKRDWLRGPGGAVLNSIRSALSIPASGSIPVASRIPRGATRPDDVLAGLTFAPPLAGAGSNYQINIQTLDMPTAIEGAVRRVLRERDQDERVRRIRRP